MQYLVSRRNGKGMKEGMEEGTEANLAVERKELQHLVHPERRVSSHRLELLVRRRHQERMDVEDQNDERIVRSNGEENGVVDQVSVVGGSVDARESDEMLLQPLNGTVNVVEKRPK